MKSPAQARPKSTPKRISYEGKQCCGPMATTRETPTNKTGYKLYKQVIG